MQVLFKRIIRMFLKMSLKKYPSSVYNMFLQTLCKYYSKKLHTNFTEKLHMFLEASLYIL